MAINKTEWKEVEALARRVALQAIHDAGEKAADMGMRDAEVLESAAEMLAQEEAPAEEPEEG